MVVRRSPKPLMGVRSSLPLLKIKSGGRYGYRTSCMYRGAVRTAHRGNKSAEADQCLAHEQGIEKLPCPIVKIRTGNCESLVTERRFTNKKINRKRRK